MTVTDLGLMTNGVVYRTVLECHADGCGSRVSIDIDRIVIDKAPEGVDVRAQQLDTFLKATHGILVSGDDGVLRFYCAAHKPAGA